MSTQFFEFISRATCTHRQLLMMDFDCLRTYLHEYLQILAYIVTQLNKKISFII